MHILLSPEESKSFVTPEALPGSKISLLPLLLISIALSLLSRILSYFSVGQISPNNNAPTFSRDFKTGSSQKEVKYCWMKCGDVITGCLFWTWIGRKANGRYWIKTDLFLEARPASALPSSFSTLSTIIKCSCMHVQKCCPTIHTFLEHTCFWKPSRIQTLVMSSRHCFSFSTWIT